ncbi:cytochrome c oxidase assembly protein subunit 15 [Alkalibacillus filiformis]|uniref:Heme A synthase n=1 Tax=Alkalibacillus filiformis TaxID=200990 RepID=A0ABU0DQI4_9BACI|nr:heme A synthase [Alkalibacillus filiformis]MDQ0350470.1 cytochrome c oxidase assembly protein subunit 15 [Alkalibacillus filiformis]
MKKIFHPKVTAIVSVISMLFVLVGGALVTKTGSGLGCGRSWPLCHGQIIPSNINLELIIEYSHRLVSGLAIIIILLLSYQAWKHFRHVRETKFLIIVTLIFIVIQSLLGAGAVLFEQSDLIKALHFGISLISFASVFLLATIIFNLDKTFNTATINIPKSIRIHFYSLFVYTLIVVYTGALVRHKQSSLVCGGWPFCSNDQPFNIGAYSLEQAIQMGHRVLAGVLFIWVIGLLIHIYKNHRHEKFLVRGWLIATLLIFAQVVLGALIIITILNPVIALMHAIMISLFFALLCYFIMLALRVVKKEK